MTTIAFKDGIMAADSCVSACGVFVTELEKLHRTSAGAIIGQSGDADARSVLKLLDKVKSGKMIPSKQKIAATETEFEFLMAFSPTDLWVIGCGKSSGSYEGYAYQITSGEAATGSGWQFAMGAMGAGKDAYGAVAVACEFDRASKLPVRTMSFKKPPLPK